MVNFKASGHAGEHKRALAAQTTEHKAVSKAEKLHQTEDGSDGGTLVDLVAGLRWE